MNRTAIFECCVDSVASAIAAIEGGCMRLEICSALNEGGLTPSLGLFLQIRKNAPEQFLTVLIRPRSGNFVYTEDELQTMLQDIALFVTHGTNGIVVGALTIDEEMDVAAMERIIAATKESKIEITFHRAIDVSRKRLEVIQRCKDLGIQRVLTSGCAPSALQGLDRLKEFSKFVSSIFPGSSRTNFILAAAGGITEQNAVQIMNEGCCDQLHASLRERVPHLMHSHSVSQPPSATEPPLKVMTFDMSEHFGSCYVTKKHRVERLLASIAWREEVGTDHATHAIHKPE